MDTFIKDIEQSRYAKMPEKITAPICLPRDIANDDVPVGTEVLLLEESHDAITRPNA